MVQAPDRRRTYLRVTLFAADPERMHGFGAIDGTLTARSRLADLEHPRCLPERRRLPTSRRRPGATACWPTPAVPLSGATVKDVVRFEGAGTSDSALFLWLGCSAKCYLGRLNQVLDVLTSRTEATSGPVRASPTTSSIASSPILYLLGLDVDPSKSDEIQAADVEGSAFMAFFTTFGSFSIAAGILLIFLVFVDAGNGAAGESWESLELIGTRRGHLVQTFTFEGVAYDLVAALVGALLGAAVAFVMVFVMAQAFDAAAGESLDIEFAVTPRSLADRVRARRPAIARRRCRLGMAGQHDDDLGRDPEFAGAPLAEAPAAPPAGSRRARARSAAHALGHYRRRGHPGHGRRLPDGRKPRARPPGGRYLVAASPCQRAGLDDRRAPHAPVASLGGRPRPALR